jgi:RNA polymerase sigma-70 factor (ECF subfamily)
MQKKEENNKEKLLFINFKKGDEVAFKYFFHKYYNQIIGFCIQFIYDKQEAEGIAQEAFLNLWKHRDTVKKVNGISAFLYTFSKSKCLNVLRHKKTKEKYSSKTLNEKEKNLNITVLNSMNFDSLTFKELENLIFDSLNELPTKTKEIFIKKRFDKMKNKEIAAEMAISIKTVEAHFAKAIQFLKIKLVDYLPTFLFFMFLK